MKTLILYATKHGAAKDIAGRIAQRMPAATVCDLNGGSIPPVSDYDCVILGSSIYAGAIRKEAKMFLAKNADTLRDKRVGLFLSGMDVSREAEAFDGNFPPELLRVVAGKGFLGGVFDPQKASLMERLIMKAVAKQSSYINTIAEDRIEQFAEGMKG